MTHALTPLRQRMIDDMRMRKLAPKTQSAFHVRRLAAFLGRSPDTASDEDLRRFQLHLVEQEFSSGALNVTITGLKFFFEVTVHHPELIARMHPVPVPRKLPQVLSRGKVTRLTASAGSPKYRAAQAVAYGAGLRAWWKSALAEGKILHGGWLFPGQNPIDPLSTRQLNRAIEWADHFP